MEIIIAGGGVAGTVAAIARARSGASVTVIEAHADPAGDVGSFLSLATNGLRGLDAIGCLERIRARGFDVARQRMWSASGRLLGDLPRGRLASDPQLSVTLMRSHLVSELRSAAADAGVTVITDGLVVGAETVDQEVRVDLDDGTSRRADLLVGADGIWSTLRTVIDPDAPHPRYAGLYAISGRTTLPEPPEAGAFNMVFGRNGVFIHLTAPGGAIWWQAQVKGPIPEPAADHRATLAGLYRDEPLLTRIIDTSTGELTVSLQHTLQPVSRWYSGRMVVIGDAAHPVGAGQGASMAIEDAIVLASLVRDRSSVPEALAAYDRARRPRITKMLKTADDSRDVKKSGPVRRRVEQAMMPFFLRHFFEKATSWLYADAPDLTSVEPVQR